MKKLLLIYSLVIIFSQSYSQLETSHWIVHQSRHMHFINDSLEFFQQTGGLAMGNDNSISDSLGNLLFFTNSEIIINANNDTMPNGYLLGCNLSRQSIIVPRPYSPDNYFIFTTGDYSCSSDFRYTEIDMTLDSGLGDVISGQANILLQTGTSDKVTAARHANGKDIWVITHTINGNTFYSYLITKDGVNSNPVISSIGTVIQDSVPINLWDSAINGHLRVSPGGRRIAISSKGLNLVEVFDFNNETGEVSNFSLGSGEIASAISISVQDPMFLEFSADGNMLYVSQEYKFSSCDSMKISQINLIKSTYTEILNSVYWVNCPQVSPQLIDRAPIQLGPDNKIYVEYRISLNNIDNPFIGVIESPQLPDTNCNFIYNAYQPIGYYGNDPADYYPNFMSSYFDKNIFATTVCFGDTTMIYTLNSYLFDSIQWEIIDPQTGSTLYSNQDTIYHLYSQPGSYEVHCYRYRAQYTDDFVKKIQVLPNAQFIGQDTMICTGEHVELSLIANNATIHWYNQYNNLIASGSTLSVNQTGTYFPVVTNYWNMCGDQIDTVDVTVVDFGLNIYDDTLSGNCITNPYSYYYPGVDLTYYETLLWNTGYTGLGLQATTSGLYSLTVSGHGCSESDSVYVIYDEPLLVNLGNNLQLCDIDSVYLEINNYAPQYEWLPSSEITQGIFASEPGQYIGSAINACGTFTDTIEINFNYTPLPLSFTDTAFCSGDSIVIDLTLPNTNYNWSTGDTLAVISISTADIYSVTVNNYCGSSSSNFNVYEDNLLALDLADTLWLNQDSILIEAGFNADFNWSTGSTQSFIWITDTGTYTLTATNTCNSVTDSVQVVSGLYIENTEFNTYIKVFPNPAKNYLIAVVNMPISEAKLQLYDVQGRLCGNYSITNGNNRINTSMLNTGMYVLNISDNDKVILSTKWVKEN